MKLIYIIIGIMFINALQLSSAEKITFKDAVERALLRNHSIKMAKVTTRIAENNVSPGNAGMLPRIDVNGGYNYSNTDLFINLVTGQRIEQSGNVSKTVNGGVQLSWTILDDLGMFINYEKLKELKNKSDIEFKISIDNTVRDIAKAYYNLILLDKNLDVLNESILLSSKRIERLKNRQEYGGATGVEILRAQVDLNTDSANFKRAQINFNNTVRLLQFLLGEKFSSEIEIDSTVNLNAKKDLQEYRDLARKTNNLILQQVKSKQITELDYKLIKTTFMPKLNFTLGYNFNRSDADAGFILVNQSYGLNSGLNLSWNIFDGQKSTIQAENSKMLAEINNITIDMVSTQIDMAVINNYESLQEKMNIHKMDIDNLNAAEQNYLRTKELYDMGQITSVELREAQLNLNRSKLRINESLIDAKLSEVELNILAGSLNYQ